VQDEKKGIVLMK